MIGTTGRTLENSDIKNDVDVGIKKDIARIRGRISQRREMKTVRVRANKRVKMMVNIRIIRRLKRRMRKGIEIEREI